MLTAHQKPEAIREVLKLLCTGAIANLLLPGIGFRVWRVEDGATSAGHTLLESGIRRRTGCSVVALRREGKNLPVVSPDTVLEVGDTVVVIGPESRLSDAASMFVTPVKQTAEESA
jgi:K+/H+ antiporter YhaU regulatory subunit KhtT